MSNGCPQYSHAPAANASVRTRCADGADDVITMGVLWSKSGSSRSARHMPRVDMSLCASSRRIASGRML